MQRIYYLVMINLALNQMKGLIIIVETVVGVSF